MKEDKLGNLSMELSVEVLKLTKELRSKHETVISNQIGRSATSICANIAESKYAHIDGFCRQYDLFVWVSWLPN